MLRGLLGFSKNQGPTPPKNQIEVVCPTCGAAQYEPRLVVSTFCKQCGVHLTIEKKRVTASNVSRAGGKVELETSAPKTATGLVPTASDITRGAGVVAGPSIDTGPLTPIGNTAGVLTSRVPVSVDEAIQKLDLSETGELGLGALMRAVTEAPRQHTNLVPILRTQREEGTLTAEADPTVPATQPQPYGLARLTGSVPTRATGAIGLRPGTGAVPPRPGTGAVPTRPGTGAVPLGEDGADGGATTTLQKMKDQGFYRQQYFKEALCFDCENKFKVGRSSRSANCPNCGALISLEDVELNMPSTHAIRTRGDVLIRKRGQLSAAHLYARELRCFGLISANMYCSGDAIFRTSGTIVGELHCRRFIVEKGSEITFMNPIYAEEVDIQSPITGNVFSKGPVLIGAYGAVNGDVTAKSVSIEPGGELNGSMNIIRSAPPPAAVAPTTAASATAE